MSTISEAIEGLRTLQQSYDTLVTTVTEWTQGEPQQVVMNDVTEIELQPNKLYVFLDRTSNLTITLSPGDEDYTNEYHFIMYIGNTVPTITFPSSVDFGYDFVLTQGIDNNKSFEVSILNNNGVACRWDN